MSLAKEIGVTGAHRMLHAGCRANRILNLTERPQAANRKNVKFSHDTKSRNKIIPERFNSVCPKLNYTTYPAMIYSGHNYGRGTLYDYLDCRICWDCVSASPDFIPEGRFVKIKIKTTTFLCKGTNCDKEGRRKTQMTYQNRQVMWFHTLSPWKVY